MPVFFMVAGIVKIDCEPIKSSDLKVYLISHWIITHFYKNVCQQGDGMLWTHGDNYNRTVKYCVFLK